MPRMSRSGAAAGTLLKACFPPEEETRRRQLAGDARISGDYSWFSPVCAMSCGAVKFRPQGGKALAAKKSAVRSGK